MRKDIITNYGSTFESSRRLHPHIWEADYCLLRGLVDTIIKFVKHNIEPGMKVIDFGCGAKPYRGLFPENIDYIGIDTSKSIYADITIEPGELVPLHDAVADCIISTQVIYLIPEYQFYLQEIKRLLKPQGKLFITTHGTWTYHPASGGDYYRFTQQGLQHILCKAGFEVVLMTPIVGTLGTGLHLRQLVLNSWLRKLPFGKVFANLSNIFINGRIIFEDKLCPLGTRLSSPVILAATAKPK